MGLCGLVAVFCYALTIGARIALERPLILDPDQGGTAARRRETHMTLHDLMAKEGLCVVLFKSRNKDNCALDGFK